MSVLHISLTQSWSENTALFEMIDGRSTSNSTQNYTMSFNRAYMIQYVSAEDLFIKLISKYMSKNCLFLTASVSFTVDSIE